MNTHIVPTIERAELIPVTEHDGRQAVSGRDLHKFLEVTTRYNDWFPRMVDYGFTEGQDFYSFLSNRSDGLSGKPSTNHAMTLDMAKELSMIQRTEKGKQARQYFIEVEKRARQSAPALPQNYAQALRAHADEVESHEATRAVVAFLAPKADAWDDLVSSAGSLSFRDAAKVISAEGGVTISGPKLTQILMDWKWAFRPPATPDEKEKGKVRSIRAYQTQIDAETLTEKAKTYTDQATGEKKLSNNPQTRITGKGLDRIRTRLIEESTETVKELF